MTSTTPPWRSLPARSRFGKGRGVIGIGKKQILIPLPPFHKGGKSFPTHNLSEIIKKYSAYLKYDERSLYLKRETKNL